MVSDQVKIGTCEDMMYVLILVLMEYGLGQATFWYESTNR